MEDDALDNSQAEPQDGQPAGESTTEMDLEGMFPIVSDEDAEGEQGEQEAQPEAQADDAAEPAEVKDETEIVLEDGRKASVRELKETFATFTRKTQELAEEKRATVAEARTAVARIAEQRANEMHLLAQKVQQLVAPGYDEAALMQLANSDPTQYFAVKARLDAVAGVQQQIQQQAQQLLQQAEQQRAIADQEAAQARDQLLQAEGARLAGQKWWNADFQNKAVAFAKKHGVPEQVARSVAYAGFVEITRKAMLYDDAMARTKNGKQLPTQAAVRPGASPARGQQMAKAKQTASAYETAKKTGDRTAIGRYLDSVLPLG